MPAEGKKKHTSAGTPGYTTHELEVDVVRWMLGLGWLGVAACTQPPKPGARVVIVLLDDIGIDKIAAYGGEGAPVTRTPTIDQLAANGVLFRNAYAMPSCSPSRGALLTGRLGRRYGLGLRLMHDGDWALPLNEPTLPRVLERAPEDWQTSHVGKWHLAGWGAPRAAEHPLDVGFDWFGGTMANLGRTRDRDPGPNGYYRWERVHDGRVSIETTYATTATIDDAIDRAHAMAPPWLMVVALHASHIPLDPSASPGALPRSGPRSAGSP